jgi:hypothetical protein
MKKDETKSIIPVERIEVSIYIVRGIKVMLDEDLALLYGIETRTLVQSVKRNIERFPKDFMFQLTKDELENLRLQFGTSNSLRSQIVMSKNRGGRRWLPYAFTEQGVAMLSSVLRSPQAVKVNIEIMRTFIKMRQFLVEKKELTKEFNQLKEFVLKESQATAKSFDGFGKRSKNYQIRLRKSKERLVLD